MTDEIPKRSTGRRFVEVLHSNQLLLIFGVVTIYVFAAVTGLAFAFLPGVSVVRPPAGIALAAVLIFGLRALPGITLGALIAHGLTLQSLVAGVGMATTETIEAASAWWLLHWIGFDSRLQRIRDVAAFVILGAFVCTFVGASLGAGMLLASGLIATGQLLVSQIGWWFGDVIAALAITPTLLTWNTARSEKGRWWEAGLLAFLLILACQIAFGNWLKFNEVSYPLAFVPFPLVMWAALRFQVFGAAVASAFTTIAGVFSILQTQAPLDWQSAYEPLLIQYAFSGAICVTALLTAAAHVERRRAEAAQRHGEDQFRSVLTAIPDLLLVLDNEGRYRQIFTANQNLLIDDAASLLGKTLAEVLPAAEAAFGMQTIERVVRTRQLAETEYALHVGGENRWFSARVVPYGTQDDPCVLWVARDLSELHHAQARLQANEQLLRKLLHLQEQERKLLAYEIHDGLVQYMVGAQMSLEGIRRDLKPENEETIQNMNWSRELITKSIGEARNLISELRPPIIDESGIIEAIRYLIDEVTSKSKVRVRFLPITEFDRLPPLLEGNVFRIVQEALTNVCRHSQASEVEIKLFHDASTLQIKIHDNGIGFDLEDIEGNQFGVEGIIKRAQLFGGRAEIESAPGGGTKIDVVLPLELPTSDEMPETVKPGPVSPSPPTAPIKITK